MIVYTQNILPAYKLSAYLAHYLLNEQADDGDLVWIATRRGVERAEREIADYELNQ